MVVLTAAIVEFPTSSQKVLLVKTLT